MLILRHPTSKPSPGCLLEQLYIQLLHHIPLIKRSPTSTFCPPGALDLQPGMRTRSGLQAQNTSRRSTLTCSPDSRSAGDRGGLDRKGLPPFYLCLQLTTIEEAERTLALLSGVRQHGRTDNPRWGAARRLLMGSPISRSSLARSSTISTSIPQGRYKFSGSWGRRPERGIRCLKLLPLQRRIRHHTKTLQPTPCLERVGSLVSTMSSATMLPLGLGIVFEPQASTCRARTANSKGQQVVESKKPMRCDLRCDLPDFSRCGRRQSGKNGHCGAH